jgi:hypothetical protein
MIVIEAILSNEIPKSHKDRIYTIINELFNNSLEHGILRLDSSLKSTPEGFTNYYEQRQNRLENLSSGEILINISNKYNKTGGILSIDMHDSGNGFDFESILSGEQNSNIYSGRGIMLVNSICETLVYTDHGRKVSAVYSWDYDWI